MGMHARQAGDDTRVRSVRRWVPMTAAAILGVSTLCGPAWGGDFPRHTFAPQSNGFVEFSTPSNNVGCFSGVADDAPELTCDRSQPTYLRFVLSPTGPATFVKNPGEQPCCSGEPLPYGESWQDGPFECDSLASGLRCSSESGHGFSISRAHIEVH